MDGTEKNNLIEDLNALEALKDDELEEKKVTAAVGQLLDGSPKCDKELLKRLLLLLERVRPDGEGRFGWNRRTGEVWQRLGREEQALRYYQAALRIREDRTVQRLLDECIEVLSLPVSGDCFRTGVQTAWQNFLEGEARLREMISRKQPEEAIRLCREIIAPANPNAFFGLGTDGERFRLSLTASRRIERLFPLVYFCRQAPDAVREHWDILIGTQPADRPDFYISLFGVRAGARDCRVYPVWEEETGRCRVSVYHEKIAEAFPAGGAEANSLAGALIENAVGEIPAMSLLSEIRVLTTPPDSEGMALSELLSYLLSHAGVTREEALDPESLLHDYHAVRMEPAENARPAYREDLRQVVTCLLPLTEEAHRGESNVTDYYHRLGIEAGCFSYSLEAFAGQDGKDRHREFRRRFLDAMEEKAGRDAYRIVAFGCGRYSGYIDFIAYDFSAVLDAARETFQDAPVAYAGFLSLRPGMKLVLLKGPDEWEEMLMS
ncbi:MAG: hypothetical protein ACOYJJ_07255 [Anaerovoracaceae bacterium]